MLTLTSGLRSLTSSYSRLSRFVVNISVRKNNNWLEEEEEAFLDEDPEVFGRSDMARMENEHRKFVKQNILKRKNFPMPKEAPILTWEAMEQMKFLNKEFPEEWTLDKITESFPVSRFTAVRILKSGEIWTEQKVIKYNQKVQNNLEALQKGNVEGNERLTNVLNSLTASNKMSLLSNCGGLKGLPMPTNEHSYSDLPKEPSFKEQLAQLRVNPFTSILAKYNRLEPVTAEKEKGETKTQKMLHAPKSQHTGKERSPYGEKSKSCDSPRSPYGNDPRSKFGNSLNVKSKSGDSSRVEYGTTLKSRSDTIPRTKFSDSPRSKFDDSPRSKYGDLPRLKSADLPRSQYGDSSRSKLGHASPRAQFSDLPKSKFVNSPKIPYGSSPKLGIDDLSEIHDLENDDLTKSEISNLFKSGTHDSSKSKIGGDSIMTSKSHVSSRSKSQYDESCSNLPSMMDIGSDSVERLYMDQEQGDAVQSEITNSPAKTYLSRKEKKKLQQAKTQELPSSKTWDLMALQGTGIKK
ncbi:uncharacterized protein LOC110443166 [Mizuhopecten yessoensis]|uniref:Neugrin n=1 Tax=Mizuhopecten yessoensis TaxID=6573 RepID=A0A210PFL9_MIZYE|nr:uncharacterized protein LOC110443166 [Mizuhopecten yessoensis]OWF35251.1 Neugrin [Mizuhopecten yessoensis]